MNIRHTQIILRPIVTEKSAQMSMLNQYVFEVTKDANKIEIAQASRATDQGYLSKEQIQGNRG